MRNIIAVKRLIVGFFIAVCCGIVGCSDSEIAAYNVSQDAHQFKVFRRVVFYNGITDTYILTIEGYSSITEDSNGKVSVIVKTENNEYLKHYLGLSDNVTYFCEQIEPSRVSNNQYRVLFKPKAIIPDIKILN